MRSEARGRRYLFACALATLAVLSSACSASRAAAAYERAREAYVRGDLAQAERAAREGADRWIDTPGRYWNFRLLTAEVLTTAGHFRDAGAILAVEPPGGAEFAQIVARRWLDCANLQVAQHRSGVRELAAARAGAKDAELLIRLDLVEGAQALDDRDHIRGEAFFHAALEKATQEKNAYYRALALNNLSVSAKRLNRYEESITYALQAMQAAQEAGAPRSAALVEGNLGASYAYLGDFDSALRHETAAVELNRKMGAKSVTMTYLGELGLIYDRADRFAEAIPVYRQAFDAAGELGLKQDAARFAENLATTLINAGKWDEAAEWNDRAQRLAEESGARANLPYVKRNRARIAWGRGSAGEATELCRELLKSNAEQPSIVWEAYETLGRISAAASHRTEANRDFEMALRVIERTRSDVLDPRYRVMLLSRLISFYRSYVDSLVAQGADVKALAVAESSRARVLSERLGRDVAVERVADAGALRASARKSGVAVVAYWLAPERSFAWLITEGGVRRFDLPPAGEIEKLVTAYRGVVEHSVDDPMQDASGKELWEKVVEPVAREIPPESRVIVVPDGSLHRLNLETLPVSGPRPHYWVEDVELAVAPSVSFALAPAGAPAADGSMLVIGAPDYTGTGYQPLPGAAEEVDALRKRFANTRPMVITGKAASPAAYRAAEPAHYSLIHFAAHADANSEKPLESAVVLSRAGDSFRLYAKDVIDVPIRADLVTLSGCRGAGARAYAGEGLMGFAWAFLHAGARAVVAGLWEVNDTATAPLMAHFYDGIAAKHSPAAALREAKLCQLRETRHTRPYYWGAFQTYIGGGSAR